MQNSIKRFLQLLFWRTRYLFRWRSRQAFSIRRVFNGESENHSLTIHPVEYYRTCEKLPLNLFIQCIIDGNIKALIISGDPTDDQLYEAWAGIYYEYVDLNANNEQLYFGILKKEIAILNWTILTVEQSLYFYTIEPRKELVDIIVDNGFEFTFLPEDPQININEAMLITNQLSPMKMRLKMKQQELKDYTENRENDHVDAQHFNKMLLRLGKYQGYSIKAKDISVAEYVGMIHYYLDDLKTKKEGMEDAN